MFGFIIEIASALTMKSWLQFGFPLLWEDIINTYHSSMGIKKPFA